MRLHYRRKPLQKLVPQRQKRSAASYLRNTASKSLARFSAALQELSKKLADPIEQPTSNEVVNASVKQIVEVPLPPNLRLDEQDLANFKAVASGGYSNIGLTPCYVNREASSAIVAVRHFPDHIEVHPMFVSVTHSMQLLDQLGEPLHKVLDEHPEAVAAKEALNTILSRRND
jgi:hypothetical protein